VKIFSRAELAAYLDHTLTRPDATAADVERLCAEARQHGFHGISVHGSRIELAYARLEDSTIKVTGLVAFPLGAADSDVKRYEVEAAIDHGARAIEYVINLGRLKDGDHRYVLREMRDIAEAADERPVTVILETHLLTHEEILRACELALDSGVQAVATGTGVNSPAATAAEVQRLRAAVGPKFGVKATGGIEEAQTAIALIEAGASRLGTSHGLAILDGITGFLLASG
jgi:deoxyribose-phosphate aldolase